MHAILILKKMALMTLALLAISAFAFSSQARAQAEEVTPGDQAEKTVEEYDVYTVIEGDNVTELVRRSIIEADQSDDSYKLNAAQVVFAETNIVQEMMCDGVLHVGDEVSVSKSKVLSYSQASQDLSQPALDNWNVYAQNVSLDLPDRTIAQNSANGGSSISVNQGSGSGVAADEIEAGENSDEDSSENDDEDDNKDGSSNSNWYWWIIGGGAVLGGWHLLGRQRENS